MQYPINLIIFKLSSLVGHILYILSVRDKNNLEIINPTSVTDFYNLTKTDSFSFALIGIGLVLINLNLKEMFVHCI